MITERQEHLLSRLLAFCGFSVTVFIYNGIAFDPVNLPKMVLLVPLSGAILGIWILNVIKLYKFPLKFEAFLTLFFILGLIVSTFLTKSNFEISFFGTAGRNTGALTYFSLSIIFFSCLILVNYNSYKKILYAALAAGYVNVLYCCFILISGGDPFPWKNPYNTFLGTLGNPDFISAFLGILFSVSLPIILLSKIATFGKLLFSSTFMLELYLISETNASQGFVVAAIGLIFFLFFIIRERFSKVFKNIYILAATTISSLAVLGMLQVGPMTNYIYKTSISLRGEYWNAGINMFKNSPIWGIGLDSYGDFYRKFRQPSSIILPGVNVTTDTAHNVLIDILAGGGILLFIPYLALNIYAAHLAIKYIKNNRKLDSTFISIFLGWITYLAQSIVSINQIGLAVWGWIFLGLMIGFTKNKVQNLTESPLQKRKKELQELAAGNFVMVVASTFVATMLVLPIAASEINWKYALRHEKSEQVIEKTNTWPRSNQRFMQTINILLQSNMPTEALKLARLNAKFDSNSYNPWFYIYNITTNSEEKRQAKSMLHSIDPLNDAYRP